MNNRDIRMQRQIKSQQFRSNIIKIVFTAPLKKLAIHYRPAEIQQGNNFDISDSHRLPPFLFYFGFSLNS